MKAIAIAVLSSVIAVTAFAETKEPCTTEPKEKWQDQEKFKTDLQSQGYKIKVFKVTKNSCYEIYGWDKAGKKVEIYFNPVTGAIVKEERN